MRRFCRGFNFLGDGKKTFIKTVAAGGIFAALSPLSVAECGEKNPPFAKFDMQKRGFAIGRNYPIVVNFPENQCAKVEVGFLSVLGDDGASDVNGDFFQQACWHADSVQGRRKYDAL